LVNIYDLDYDNQAVNKVNPRGKIKKWRQLQTLFKTKTVDIAKSSS